MRGWTFGVLFVCWSGLSAAAWWLFRPALIDWATNQLAGQIDSNQIELIANALPFVASAFVVLVLFLVTRRARRSVITERSAVPEAAPLYATTAAVAASRKENAGAPRAVTRRLYIKPAGTLVNSGARFGVVVLPNGATVHGAGARAEHEIYFKKLDDRGTLMAQIPYDHQRSPRLKCFVDYKGLKFECVRHALTASRFIMVTPRADRRFRAWFLLPGTRIGRALDDKPKSPA
jgi:hypothetical protein